MNFLYFAISSDDDPENNITLNTHSPRAKGKLRFDFLQQEFRGYRFCHVHP